MSNAGGGDGGLGGGAGGGEMGEGGGEGAIPVASQPVCPHGQMRLLLLACMGVVLQVTPVAETA